MYAVLTLLLSQLVGPACVQARSSNPRGMACGPSGKGSGEEGILSGVVPVYRQAIQRPTNIQPGTFCYR